MTDPRKVITYRPAPDLHQWLIQYAGRTFRTVQATLDYLVSQAKADDERTTKD